MKDLHLQAFHLVELAGLEPATSWVRSRIRGFRTDPSSPRIRPLCRQFGVTLCPRDTAFPPIAVHGRVVYGLQPRLPPVATDGVRGRRRNDSWSGRGVHNVRTDCARRSGAPGTCVGRGRPTGGVRWQARSSAGGRNCWRSRRFWGLFPPAGRHCCSRGMRESASPRSGTRGFASRVNAASAF